MADVEIDLDRSLAPRGFAWIVPFRRGESSMARVGLMSSDNPGSFHSPEELASFYRMTPAPNGHGGFSVDSSILFPPAAQCGTCHSSDPTFFALRAADGTDVNMYDD